MIETTQGVHELQTMTYIHSAGIRAKALRKANDHDSPNTSAEVVTAKQMRLGSGLLMPLQTKLFC